MNNPLTLSLNLSRETLADLSAAGSDAGSAGPATFSGTCGWSNCTWTSCSDIGYSNPCCTACSC